MALKEYKPGTTFPGVIGLTKDQSSPDWPEPMRARAGTPKVLLIVLDDTGYGQLGCSSQPRARKHWTVGVKFPKGTYNGTIPPNRWDV